VAVVVVAGAEIAEATTEADDAAVPPGVVGLVDGSFGDGVVPDTAASVKGDDDLGLMETAPGDFPPGDPEEEVGEMEAGLIAALRPALLLLTCSPCPMRSQALVNIDSGLFLASNCCNLATVIVTIRTIILNHYLPLIESNNFIPRLATAGRTGWS